MEPPWRSGARQTASDGRYYVNFAPVFKYAPGASRVLAMPLDTTTPVIAHAIQLAIAPVFLLTGIAGLLGVMANRLARVIDRARYFETSWSGLDANAQAAARLEIRNLERRRRVCSWSINYCTVAALLVCLVIVTLFIEEFFATNLKSL